MSKLNRKKTTLRDRNPNIHALRTLLMAEACNLENRLSTIDDKEDNDFADSLKEEEDACMAAADLLSKLGKN